MCYNSKASLRPIPKSPATSKLAQTGQLNDDPQAPLPREALSGKVFF